MLANLLSLKKIRILYFLPLLVIYALCSLQLPAAASDTVTIAWDKNAETDVIGYKFHYGIVSKNYQYTVDVKNNTSCSISGLAEGTTYYFAVTAYNDKNIESSYSEELTHTIPNTPPPPPPPPVDTDGDGLFDDDETSIYGTDPNKADTDGDGMNDGDELAFWGDNWSDDSDKDGLVNLVDPDSDNDGYNDAAANVTLDISNLSNASAAEYQIVEGLTDGNACYVDRSYTYSNLPDFLQGAVYIKTANNDKNNMADPLLSFDVNTDATVYVAFDNRAPIPSWLSEFTDTGYDLKTDVSFSIYAKDFPPGSVTLGPNGYSGSMYVVIIK